MRRVRVVVRGRVQGVGFRMFLAGRARGRGVGGWGRNRADGSVEAVLEGEDAAVESLVRACGEGPRGAVVESCEVHDEPAEGVSSFEIR